MAKILIVEDDLTLAQEVASALSGQNCDVDTVVDWKSAFGRLDDTAYDLIILDAKLPGLSAEEVLAGARAQTLHVPILILTINDSFYLSEVASRIRSFLRIGKPKLEFSNDESPQKAQGKLILQVSDRFQLANRGLVVVGVPATPCDVNKYRDGDYVSAKSPDGCEQVARLFLETGSPNSSEYLAIGLAGLTKEEVPVGTEVWWISPRKHSA